VSSHAEWLCPRTVPVSAGPFTMGTHDGEIDRSAATDPTAAEWKATNRFSREQPQHTLTLEGFSMGVHPVTVGAYRRFVDGGGYRDPRFWLPRGWTWAQDVGRERPDHWDDKTWSSDDRLPVIGVSWYEASAYCRWLSAGTGEHYSLPSEAEWEKSARGHDARIYPWGDRFDATRCNTRVRGQGRTLPVGDQGAMGGSPYGCEEMAGNVSEWTRSLFRSYPYVAGDGRESEDAEGERVTRGGSWCKPAIRSRVAVRGSNDPWFADTDLGFRVALHSSGLRT